MFLLVRQLDVRMMWLHFWSVKTFPIICNQFFYSCLNFWSHFWHVTYNCSHLYTKCCHIKYNETIGLEFIYFLFFVLYIFYSKPSIRLCQQATGSIVCNSRAFNTIKGADTVAFTSISYCTLPKHSCKAKCYRHFFVFCYLWLWFSTVFYCWF